MLSLKKCREIDPLLKETSDEELTAVLEALYDFGKLVMEEQRDQKGVPKIPFGSKSNF